MGRLGKGAVAAGVVAWVTPEILIATPTTAGAISQPPQCQDKDGDNDDCDPDPNGGDGDDKGGDGGGDNNPSPNNGNNGDNGPAQSSPSGGATAGAGGGSQGSGPGPGPGNPAQPQFAAAGGSGGPAGSTLAAQQGTSGGSLPFTGSNLLLDTEVAGALIGGGWLMTRWAARRRTQAADGGPDDAPLDE
jgi:hypothetical protein